MIVDNLVHFARVLRRAGLQVGPDRVLSAIAAVQAVGIERREDLHAALSAVMLDRHEQQAIFDAAFDAFFRDPKLLERLMYLMLPKVAGRGEKERAAQAQRLSEALSAPREKAPRPQAPQADQDEVVRSNLRMGKWETDNIPFPGGVFRQMVRDFLRGNRLVQGQWTIGEQVADLSRIRAPFLHLLAREDHITPYASSRDLVRLVGSADKQELIIKGGHVGLVAGRGAELRMWPALNAWLAPRSV